MASAGDWLVFLEHGMNPQNTPVPNPATVPAQSACRPWLSALMDGQPDAVEQACAHWANDAQARRAWHEYQLIGDVLRSDDLALSPTHDQAFLHQLRQRLVLEPAIVAPAPMAATPSPSSSRQWAVAAAAAGFLMVGGVVWLLQGLDNAGQQLASGPGAAGASLTRVSTERAPAGARATLSSAAAPGSTASAALGDPQWRVLDGQMIRDERLDAYLRAHRGIAAARPGAGAGRFETVVLER